MTDERTPGTPEPERREDEQEDDLRHRQGEFLQNLLTDVPERKQQAADELFSRLAEATRARKQTRSGE